MKFNLKIKSRAKETTNFEGEKAFVLTPQLELYTAVATAALSDQFYEKANDKLIRLRELISKNDAAFVAKLAVYAREQMYLRSVPLVLAVELAKQQTGNELVGKMTGRVVQRADEITELLSYYAIANERTSVKKLNKLSKQLQKGLAAAFNKFDEYQFAKYNRDAEVKLKDALFLIHPKAKDEAQQVLFDKIANDELQVPYTWEVELSALGQLKYDTVELKKAAQTAKWEELIMSNKMGYMATMRNLRNIINKIKQSLINTFHEVDTWFDVNDNLLHHRPANNGWTVREILEHITLTNHFLLILIKKGTAKALAATKDADYENQLQHYDLDWNKLQQIGEHNSFEWNRPAHMEPGGTEDLLIIRNRMQAQLNECLQYLTELKNGEGILYKTTMTVNGLGKIDVYHYIYFLAQHARRHLGQMESLKNEFGVKIN